MQRTGIKIEVPDIQLHHYIHSPPMDWPAIFCLVGTVLLGLLILTNRK